MLRTNSLRLSSSLFQKFHRCASSTPNPAPSSEKVLEENNETPATKSTEPQQDFESGKGKSKLVTSAFASLSHNQGNAGRSPIDVIIKNAKTAEELLSLAEKAILTKKQAMKVVTTLSELSFNGKTTVEVEKDPRFKALCQQVSQIPAPKAPSSTQDGDLSVVLGVMSEDEASKIINTLTVPQMIKVLSSLSYKKRRSVPILKALSFNISSSASKLDVKQSADILYASASLNFPDEVLLEKVCGDLLSTILNCQKSAVIGSICTSIGLLRYKDIELLDCLCKWALENKKISRPQDLVSLILCLASVTHVPKKDVIEMFLGQVTENDVVSASTWLDVVWSLAILDAALESHISSVLNPKFVERLSNTIGNSSVNWKRKLLNINGLAKLKKGYKGPLLKEESPIDIQLAKPKDKQHLYISVIDTLSNLLPSSQYFRVSVETGMGFLIDAECMFDAKMNPMLLLDKKTGQPLQLNGKRLALLICDYHDCTRGQVDLCGATAFKQILLGLLGYKVVTVKYTDFNPSSKLIDRAKYIDGILKSSASSPPV